MGLEGVNNSKSLTVTNYERLVATQPFFEFICEAGARVASVTRGIAHLAAELFPKIAEEFRYLGDKLGFLGDFIGFVDIINSVNFWVKGKKDSIANTIHLACYHFRQMVSSLELFGVDLEKLTQVIGTIPVLKLCVASSKIIGYSCLLWHKFKVIKKTERNLQEKKVDLLFWKRVQSLDKRLEDCGTLKDQETVLRDYLKVIEHHDESKIRKIQVKASSLKSAAAQDAYLAKKAEQITTVRGHMQFAESQLNKVHPDHLTMINYIKERADKEVNVNEQKQKNAITRIKNEKVGTWHVTAEIAYGVVLLVSAFGLVSPAAVPVLFLGTLANSMGLYEFIKKSLSN